MPFIALALVGALAVGGGVSIAAQGALPGSPLYFVKVDIDENVQASLALSDSARADWDLKAIQTRLEEARQLAASGDLDASAQSQIDNNFDTHTYDLGIIIARLRASGDSAQAAQVAAKLQGMLTAQQTLLTSSASLSDSAKATMVPVIAEVNGALSAATILTIDAAADTNPGMSIPADPNDL